MRFEWDENKRLENFRKHGLDFVDACDMFALPMLVGPDVRRDYGEERWLGIGLAGSRVSVVVFTERLDEAERVVRIISMRKALKHEREAYEKEIPY